MALYTKSDWSRGIVLRDRATKAPLDLTGWAFEMVVKAKRSDAAALVTLATGGSGLLVDPQTPGRVIVSMTDSQTTQIGAGYRCWALYRTDGARRQRIIGGSLNVLEGV